MVPGLLGILKSRSALAELRSAAGGLETVLLALFHTRIAGQQTDVLQDGAAALVDRQRGKDLDLSRGMPPEKVD